MAIEKLKGINYQILIGFQQNDSDRRYKNTFCDPGTKRL
jgi:hypothetical protein